jgi:hypothetical protein
MKRVGIVFGIIAGSVLGVSACTTRTSTDVAPFASPSAVMVGGTLVDCGQGQRAVLQQASDRTQVLCVAADATVGTPVGSAVGTDGLQPIPVGARPPAAVHAASAPVRPATYEPRSEPRTATRRTAGRTWKKSAVIIGGSTAAGAGVGAVMGGGSGAKKGAVVGLLGGVVYDIATRDR